MADIGSIGSELTPIVNSVSRVTSVLPGSSTPKVTSDQAADVISAKDTKDSIRNDHKSPLWQRLVTHGLAGAAAGGIGLGAKAGLIAGGVSGHPWQGAAWGTGIGALAGGGVAVASELFDKATEGRRIQLANRTIENADPRLLARLKHPDAKKPAEAYNASRSMPVRGLELGALLGGVGGGAFNAYHTAGNAGTKELGAARGALLGMAGAGALGLLAGSVIKHLRREKLVKALTKKASIWLTDNKPKFETPTGGNPRKASNRQLTRALAGTPERYASGRLTNIGKIAADVGLDKEFWKEITTGGGQTYQVYTVNGPYVRNHIDVGFIGGSNPEADPKYVPKGEIWIENTLTGQDRDAILVHEKTEATVMSEDDREYHDAHIKANDAEEIFREKTAADAPKLRARSEVCIYSQKGILGIKKDGYLLMPGGGIDDGETPELAVAREAIEEADCKVLHLKAMGTSETIWPDDVKQVKGFDGSRTYHFMALDGGKIGTQHEDNERFGWIGFDEAKDFLAECAKRDDQKSAKDQNEIRKQSIIEAEDAVKAGHIHPVKLANRIDIDIPTQLDDHSCGPACLAGIRAFRGEFSAPQQKIAADLDTDEDVGTHPIKISQALGYAGMEYWTEEGVRMAIDAGRPVLMLCKDAAAEDHYVVAVGYDDKALHVDDPSEPADRQIPWTKLAEVWKSTDIEALTRYGWEIAPQSLHVENVKTADALNLVDRPEYVLFNHEGKIMVAPDGDKRYRLPTAGKGVPAPYEPVQRFLPPNGAPEPGVHGYNVHLNVGDAEDAPGFEGGTWQDPHTVLKSMYGSMGLKSNAHFRELDRARARVILKAMKKRTPAPAAPVIPAAPVMPSILKTAADWAQMGRNVAGQIPKVRGFDTVVGGVLGGAAGLLRHVTAKREDADLPEAKKHKGIEWGNLAKRVGVGAAVGAAGMNILGDRARRYVSNNISPFGYKINDRIHEMKPRSLSQVVRTAILDKPANDSAATHYDGPVTQQRYEMRRELLRRGLGVHTTNPTTDMFTQTGTDAEGDPTVKLNPAFVKSHPENSYVKAWTHDPTSQAAIDEGTGIWGGYSRTKVQVDGKPGIRVQDKWDFDLHDNEKDYLKSLLGKAIHHPIDFARSNPDIGGDVSGMGSYQVSNKGSLRNDFLKSTLARQMFNSYAMDKPAVYDETFPIQPKPSQVQVATR